MAPREDRRLALVLGLRPGLGMSAGSEMTLRRVDKDTLRARAMARRLSCFSRGPRFDSQNSHGSSYLPKPPVSGDPTPSYRHTCGQNTNVHEIRVNHSPQFLLPNSHPNSSLLKGCVANEVLSSITPSPTPKQPSQALQLCSHGHTKISLL